ncbi:circadian clock protein KaiA [Oscillatoria sp. FACHB-1407]|uniref:circadian clock protein KaiA n=1 Tax=Oscillatoria sp. FACHB-1407 TaxID=2692847 RepID=UPI0016852A73|nr:circadian clock protein KaiA [Oscillatoria sp. FACHB-1407]MBD2461770.1 circadian clock protein KaiA [Oscillatoria sp. FACHB-1407]
MASSQKTRSKIALCALLQSEALAQALAAQLQPDSVTESGDHAVAETASHRFVLTRFQQESDFLYFLQQTHSSIDCLILEDISSLPKLFHSLQTQSILIPALVLTTQSSKSHPTSVVNDIPAAPGEQSQEAVLYHAAVLQVDGSNLSHISDFVEEAIANFLNLSAPVSLTRETTPGTLTALNVQRSLMQQQQRLAEKLKERLGYLGVYYKRNPAHFLRHMNELERQELLQQLKADYRHIILHYFANDNDLNQSIDSFVDLAFFADVPVAQIVEIHMDLMDEFSKQLKLEGRSEEILLDYRLTLIDTLAHLCEMYRRSIPRES